MPTKILLLEDHFDSALVTARLLQKQGYMVFIASDCREALAIAKAEKPDIALCDIALPDGDGCDVFRELKAQQDIVGIAFSAHAMIGDQQRYAAAGFEEILVKPCSVSQLSCAIDRALQVKTEMDLISHTPWLSV